MHPSFLNEALSEVGKNFAKFTTVTAAIGAIVIGALGFGAAKIMSGNDGTIGVNITEEQQTLIKHGAICPEHLHAAFTKALQESKEKAKVVDLVLPPNPGVDCQKPR